MRKHVQTRAFYPACRKSIEVDAGIMHILLILWDAEIITCNSCEEIEPGMMWIEFYSNEDVEKFLWILIESLGDQIYSHPEADDWFCYRILGQGGESLRSWQYYAHPNISPAKCNKRSIYPRKLRGCKVELSVSLRFPREDYSKVLNLLSSYMYREKGSGSPISEIEYVGLIRSSRHGSVV